MSSGEQHFDGGRVITRAVYTSDNKHVGHIDGLDDVHFIIKDKIVHARYYVVPREILESCRNGKVKLRISEEELNSKYRKNRPMYFESPM
jgi:hypothetical protein